MWLHSLTAPETIFYQLPRHPPVSPRQRCSHWLTNCQHYLYNIPTLLKQFIFFDCLDPDDRGSKLIQKKHFNWHGVLHQKTCLFKNVLITIPTCLYPQLSCITQCLSCSSFANNMSDTGNRHSWLDVCIPQKNTPCTNGHQTSRVQQSH
jgi:hypothetical protein